MIRLIFSFYWIFLMLLPASVGYTRKKVQQHYLRTWLKTFLVLFLAPFASYSDWNNCNSNLLVSNDLVAINAAAGTNNQPAIWPNWPYVLTVGVYARNSFSSLSVASPPEVDFFIDTDQNRDTGDARPGAVRGAELRVTCRVLAGFAPVCTLYSLPSGTYGEPVTSSISPQAMLLPNDPHQLQVSLPVNSTAADIFAFAHGKVQIFGNGAGNGDRCPDAGVFDSTSGTVKVRHPAPAINSKVIDSSGNQLADWSFSTFGDQFHIEISFQYLINLQSLNFTGELQFDTDKSLTTGLFHNPWVVGGPLKEEIPTWGWDVAIVFGGGGSQTGGYDTPISLDFGKQSAFIAPPHNYAYPYGFAFGEGYNDGRWFVSGNKLILEGSLSMLDARKWSSDASGGNRLISIVGSNGNVVGRLFANNIFAASIADMIPKDGYAFDVASNSQVASIQWSPAATSINLPYGGVMDPEAHYDLSRIDAQVKNGNLTVKGTIQRLDTTWSTTDFVLLLDTDMNSSTGTKVNDIGVDYTVFVSYVDMYTYTGYTTTLIKPGGIKEGHDSWLNIDYSNSSQVNSPADITITVPMQSIGNPNNIRLYLATVTSGIASLQDVAPAQPIVLLSSNTDYPLTVSKASSGSGTVTSSPAGIDCGADCSENYPSTTSVTLTATPAAGYSFTGWGGACTGANTTCTVSMTKDQNVEATFVWLQRSSWKRALFH
ncbi:MAG: hypothetical protein WCS87_16530 [Methylococcaceae bacterium]